MYPALSHGHTFLFIFVVFRVIVVIIVVVVAAIAFLLVCCLLIQVKVRCIQSSTAHSQHMHDSTTAQHLTSFAIGHTDTHKEDFKRTHTIICDVPVEHAVVLLSVLDVLLAVVVPLVAAVVVEAEDVMLVLLCAPLVGGSTVGAKEAIECRHAYKVAWVIVYAEERDAIVGAVVYPWSFRTSRVVSWFGSMMSVIMRKKKTSKKAGEGTRACESGDWPQIQARTTFVSNY